MKDDDVRAEFEKLVDLYGNLSLESEELKKILEIVIEYNYNNIYLSKEGKQSIYDKYLNGKNSYMYSEEDITLLRQEEIEMSIGGLNFFRPYFKELIEYQSKYLKSLEEKRDIPDLPDCLRLNIPSLFGYTLEELVHSENKKNAENKYINLSEDERKAEFAKIYKELAIIYARKANAWNRLKKSPIEVPKLYANKSRAIQDFLIYTIKYNALVNDSEKIVFGINPTEKGPAITACLPGHTRFSVHFGSIEKCIFALGKVNYELKDNFFTDIKNIDINDPNLRISNNITYLLSYLKNNEKLKEKMQEYMQEIYEKFKFNIPNPQHNTGLILNFPDDLKEKYKNKMIRNDKNKMNVLKAFCYMNPDLGDRDIFYLAEGIGLGKEILEELTQILKERESERKKIEEDDKVKKMGYMVKKPYVNSHLKEAYQEKLLNIINDKTTSDEEYANAVFQFYECIQNQSEEKSLIIKSIKDFRELDRLLDFIEKEQADYAKVVLNFIIQKGWTSLVSEIFTEDEEWNLYLSENTKANRIISDIDYEEKLIIIYKIIEEISANDTEEISGDDIEEKSEDDTGEEKNKKTQVKHLREAIEILEEGIKSDSLSRKLKTFINIIKEVVVYYNENNIKIEDRNKSMMSLINKFMLYFDEFTDDRDAEHCIKEFLNEIGIEESNSQMYEAILKIAEGSNIIDRNIVDKFENGLNKESQKIEDEN